MQAEAACTTLSVVSICRLHRNGVLKGL